MFTSTDAAAGTRDSGEIATVAIATRPASDPDILELRGRTRRPFTAKYEDGVFRPLEDVSIKEGTIVEVRVPPEDELPRKRPSIKDLPFYGMWADRDDITDGVSFVNKLRDNPRGR